MSELFFFSILIPVYNSSIWLSKCLDSVVCAARNLSDFTVLYDVCRNDESTGIVATEKIDYLSHKKKQTVEIICVDDGSTDDSGKILDNYKKQLENESVSIGELPVEMNIVHQRNSGVSIARNVAIKQAKGEWIVFIDSDDWIGENYLTEAWKVIQRDSSLDLLATTVELVIDGKQYINVRQGISKRLFEGDLLAETHRNEYMPLRSSFCDLVIRGDIIRKYSIHFSGMMRQSEDSLFAETVFAYSKKMLFAPEIKSYFYRRESNHISLSKQINVNDIKAGMFRVLENIRLFNELTTKGTRLNACHCALGEIFAVKTISDNERNEYLSWLIDNKDFINTVVPFLSKYGCNYKTRIFAWVLRLFPKILCLPILKFVTGK